MEGQKDKIHPTGSQEGEKWPKMTKKCSLFLEQRTNEGDMSNVCKLLPVSNLLNKFCSNNFPLKSKSSSNYARKS